MEISEITKKPRHIAILGGGIGAISAAFTLTSEPDWHYRYQITVYQQGWRLGGKGASGRNAREHDRIEEHGLHMWWGFYDHAFALMKACYDELDDPRFDFASQFSNQDSIGFVESLGERCYQKTLSFPSNSSPLGETPGTDLSVRYLRGLSAWLRHIAASADDRILLRILSGSARHFVRLGLHRPLLRRAARSLASLARRLERHAERDRVSIISQAFDGIARILRMQPWQEEPHFESAIGRRVCLEFALWLRGSLRPPEQVSGAEDYECRWYYIWLDFLLTTLSGVLRDGLFVREKGFDDLDDEELSTWLLRHGINAEVTLGSVLLRGLYDAAFCFVGGDTLRPNISAGVALRTFVRMFLLYKGSYMFRMMGGMGDVIFAPLYLALLKRAKAAELATGAADCLRVEFFHRVEELHLSEDADGIARIDMTRQAMPRNGRYQPLGEFGEERLPVWPTEPFYEQLEEGETLRVLAEAYPEAHPLESTFADWEGVEQRRLLRGRDFDSVILGISIAGLPRITGQLAAHSRPWAEMLAEIKTIRTQAAQIWLRKSFHELGWHARDLPVIAGHADPLNSLADMSHVLAMENWPTAECPVTVVYFCGPMTDDVAEPDRPAPDYPRTQTEWVRRELEANLARHAKALWPHSGQDGASGFDWDLLVAPGHLRGVERLQAQYCRANIDPSERYVLALAGTLKFRLAPSESGFANLVLAGDWTRTELNFGCVEAAAQSGLAAARAILRGAHDSENKDQGRSADTARPLPLYRPSFSEQVFRPPYRLAGATFQTYMLPAPERLLRQACDRYLNGITPDWRFEPLGQFVLFMIGYVHSNRAVFGPEAGFGDGPELSFAVVLPVTKRGRGGTEPGLFPVVALVDNSLSLATGREVLGFSKQIGWFEGDLDNVGSPIAVETLVFERHDPRSRLARKPLIRIEPVPDLDSRSSEVPRNEREYSLGRHAWLKRILDRGAGGEIPPILDLIKLLRTRRLAVFNLLQIRDLQQQDRACLQKVTKSYLRIDTVHGGGRLPAASVDLFAYDSHPIARDLLGLAHAHHGLQPLAGFWLRYDAIQEVFNELDECENQALSAWNGEHKRT